MRAALDSNVLLYAEGLDDAERGSLAVDLVARLPADTVIAVQALGEVYNVLVRKARCPRAYAQQAAGRWRARFALADTTDAVMREAMDLATAHPMSIWDAVQLAAAAGAGCGIFLSEDLRAGFHWRGVTVVNPFADPTHPLLAALLD